MRAPGYMGAAPGPEDPILAGAGRAASIIATRARELPPGERPRAVRELLAMFGPRVPAKVSRAAAKLEAEGWPAPAALERAMQLTIADRLVSRFVEIGERSRIRPGRGAEAVRKLTAELSGLGDVGSWLKGAAEDVWNDAVKPVMCHPVTPLAAGAVASISSPVAGAAAGVGAEVAQAVVCPPGTKPAPAASPPAPPPPKEPKTPKWLGPAIIGGAALVTLGIVALGAKKKKKGTPAS